MQAVRNAVVKRLEWLDSNFLAALNAYLAAPSVQHNKELSDLLRAVRNEVLDLVSTHGTTMAACNPVTTCCSAVCHPCAREAS